MILTGQIFLIISLFLLGARTRKLSKVDNNRRIRLGLLPSNELYQGRMLRHLFSFDRIVEGDTEVDKQLIRESDKIDKYMIFCLSVFAIFFIMDLLNR